MPKNKIIPISIISVILFVGVIIIFMYETYQPGVLLSCEKGDFVKFVSIGTPQKMAFFPGYCSGKIQILTINKETVCNIDDYNSEEDTFVRIRCPDLRYYKDQNLTINFWTYSIQYGNYSGTVNIKYP